MNQAFDIKRFGKVLAYDLRRLSPRNFRTSERVGNMGLNIITFAFLPTVVNLVLMLMDNGSTAMSVPARWYMLFFQAIIIAALVPEVHYNAVNQPKGGTYYAMLPASKFEKYLSMLLMTIIVCPLLALCGAFVVDTLVTMLPLHINSCYLWQGFDPLSRYGINVYNELPAVYSVHAYLTAIFGYILFAMAFVFGNTLFRKGKTARTMLCLFGIGLVVSIATLFVTIAVTANSNVDLATDYHVMSVLTGAVYGWVKDIGLGMQVLLIALLTYYSWRRIKRMEY